MADSKKELDTKRFKQDDAIVEPRSPKRKQSVIIQDNQSSTECNIMSQANSFSNKTDVSMTAANSSSANELSTHSSQYNHLEYIPDKSLLSNYQPQIENVRSLVNVDDQKLLVNEVSSHKLSTSQGLGSLNTSARLNSYGGRRLIPIQKTVEKRLQCTTIQRNLAITAQNFSDLIDQTRQKQMHPNQLNKQQQMQRPKVRIGISIKSKDRKQMHSRQGITKKTLLPILTNVLNSLRQTLSTTHNNRPTDNPQMQARISQRSEDNNEDLTVNPQNIIKSEISNRKNTEMTSRSIYQPSTIQRTTAHENENENLSTQEELVDQPIHTNSKAERVYFMDDAATSTVTGSHLNVMNNEYQSNEWMVNETLPPHYAVSSDSHVVTDQKVISDHEMSIDEAPAETMNNVDGTANILEQQMLDNFTTVFTQLGSILRQTADMYNTLRSSILDTAKTYRNSLGNPEHLTMARNASNSSFSSNLKSESSRSSEERHTKVTTSASSSNDVAKKMPIKKRNIYRFVLPPEYDAYDSRWTLRYRTSLPGLVELMPQSGIYVSYADLNYCQLKSKDCKSLARRILTGVFSRNALSVCTSMREKAQVSKNIDTNIRPDLDDHACSIMLHFVLEHGLKHNWNTDLQPILSTLHSKMQEIRFKYGVMVAC